MTSTTKPTKFSHQFNLMSFTAVRNSIRREFLQSAHAVHTERWQSQDITDMPAAQMMELLNVDINVPLTTTSDIKRWAVDTKANVPWADDHFEERVCGFPINPGTQWKKWPWGLKAQDSLNESGMFNHNYMERYWPRYAGYYGSADTSELFNKKAESIGLEPERVGIRHRYGDLNDLIDLLHEQPLTRQAWLPIFFPEDTGTGDGGRKPCSLGYQFMVRDKRMHIYYPLRSCDFYRHWGDDVYMTIRLGLWVLEKLRDRDPWYWNDVLLGNFSMHCTSLHLFVNDFIAMRDQK